MFRICLACQAGHRAGAQCLLTHSQKLYTHTHTHTHTNTHTPLYAHVYTECLVQVCLHILSAVSALVTFAIKPLYEV